MTATQTHGDNNAQNYTDTMDHARLLSNNWKTARDRTRKLARSLVLAAVDDNYQLEALIEDTRKAMTWGKLDAKERNSANGLFKTLRTIVGAWGSLGADVQKQFREGHLIFSTLAKTIMDARKAADEAEAKADDTSGTDTPDTAKEPEARAVPEAPQEPIHMTAMRVVAEWLASASVNTLTAEEAEMLAKVEDAAIALHGREVERLDKAA